MEFKRGDFVICLDDSKGSFTKGRFYKVGGKYFNINVPSRNYSTLGIERDDYNCNNGWGAYNFIRADLTELEKVIYGI